MKKSKTWDFTPNFLFNRFDYDSQTTDLDKIRIAKQIIRIRNGTYEYENDMENHKLMGDSDLLKVQTPSQINKSINRSPVKIYENMDITPLKHFKVKNIIKHPLSKEKTVLSEDELDLSTENILKGDNRLNEEKQLVFLRFLRTPELRVVNDQEYNSFDFLDKNQRSQFFLGNLSDPKFFKENFYQRNKNSEFKFYADFVGGNLWKVYQTGADEFDVYPSVETNSTKYSYWFYFKARYSGKKKTRQIRFNIKESSFCQKSKKIFIWQKRTNLSRSIYNYRRRQKSKGWSNTLPAFVNYDETTNNSVISFKVSFKRNEEISFCLGFPYFMTDFFENLGIRGHPLSKIQQIKTNKPDHMLFNKKGQASLLWLFSSEERFILYKDKLNNL